MVEAVSPVSLVVDRMVCSLLMLALIVPALRNGADMIVCTALEGGRPKGRRLDDIALLNELANPA